MPETYPPSQTISEIVKCSHDIEYFTNRHVKFNNLKGSDFIKLYPKQAELLKSWQNNPRSVLLAARQTGKTTLACIFAIYQCIFNSCYTSMIVSSKSNMSSLVQAICEHIIDGLNGTPFSQSYAKRNKEMLMFGNSSKIYFTPSSALGTAIRGHNVDFLFLDEVDYHEEFEKYYLSMMPLMSSHNSIMVMAGTPNYDVEKSILRKYAKNDDFHASVFHWSEVPHWDEKWAMEMRKICRDDKIFDEIFDAEFNIRL